MEIKLGKLIAWPSSGGYLLALISEVCEGGAVVEWLDDNEQIFYNQTVIEMGIKHFQKCKRKLKI